MFTMIPRTPARLLGPLVLLMAAGASAASEPDTAASPDAAPPHQPTTIVPAKVSGPSAVVPPPTGSSLPNAQTPLPGRPAEELGLGINPPLIREGAFVSNARGQMVRGKSGRWFFVFDRDAAGRTFPPMILAEGPNLAAMERLSERATPGSRMRVGGQVLVYRDRNFLLVTTPPLLERPMEPPPAGAAAPDLTPASAPASSAQTESPGERSIEQIIADLDRAAGPRDTIAIRRPLTAGSLWSGSSSDTPPDSAAQAAATVADSRTLGYLASRRGRLVRTGDGWLQFRLDTGPNGRTEPAMTILPSQNLMRLEDLAAASGESITLTMSGDVLLYKGRQYLLPSTFSVNRASENLTPMH